MENDIPPVNRVDEIREHLSSLEGKRLKVKANMGRSRIVERTGTLVHAHPSLFVVEVEERLVDLPVRRVRHGRVAPCRRVRLRRGARKSSARRRGYRKSRHSAA